LLKYQLFVFDKCVTDQSEKLRKRKLSIITESFITNGNLKSIQNSKLTFFKPQLDCIPLTILLFHHIALAAFVIVVHAREMGNRKIRAGGSLLKNHFCATGKKGGA